MGFTRAPRRFTFWASPAIALAAVLVSCSGSQPKPAPTASPATTPTPAQVARPPGCHDIPDDVCAVALAMEAALLTGDDSKINVDPAAKESFRTMLDRRTDPLRVVSIGCPFAAAELGCGATFALGISAITPGTDASRATGLTYSAVFVRDADCDFSPIYTTGVPADGASSLCRPDGAAGTPVLSQVIHVTDPEWLNPIVNGDFAQGGTLAGRPKGITDTHVRSEWFSFPDKPQVQVPAVLKGVPRRTLTLTQSVPLDRLLFIASGCWGCDGPTSGLDRVYPLGGTVVKEQVTLPDDGIRDIAVRPNAQEIILVTCQLDHCGDFGPAQPEMVSTVHRSVDGGMSWETVATFEDYASVGPFTADGYIVTVWTPAADLVGGEYSFYLMPERRRLTRPTGTAESPSMRVLPDGSVAFQSEDGKRWLREDGSVGYELPFDVDSTRVQVHDIPGGAHFISWSVDLGGPRRVSYQVLWRNGSAQLAYAGDNEIGWRVGQWLSDPKFIGNVFVSDKQLGLPNSNLYEYERSVPVYVDLERGAVTPIDTPFFDANYRMNRTYVLGSVPGNDLARVNTPGDCLNLREAGSSDAKVITCLRHGTLVNVDALGGTPAPGWVRVLGPTGQIGYVSTEFLDR